MKLYCGYGNAKDLDWKVGYEKDNGLVKISWAEGKGFKITTWISASLRLGLLAWPWQGDAYPTVTVRY